jgi:hypothetical protein
LHHGTEKLRWWSAFTANASRNPIRNRSLPTALLVSRVCVAVPNGFFQRTAYAQRRETSRCFVDRTVVVDLVWFYYSSTGGMSAKSSEGFFVDKGPKVSVAVRRVGIPSR